MSSQEKSETISVPRKLLEELMEEVKEIRNLLRGENP